LFDPTFASINNPQQQCVNSGILKILNSFWKVISRWLPFLAFVRKNNPHIRVLAGFLEFYVLKQGAKFIPIPGALAGFWRGANLPYFSKRDDIQAYFPHEQKRRVLRGFRA
jgi:hypothetical protein